MFFLILRLRRAVPTQTQNSKNRGRRGPIGIWAPAIACPRSAPANRAPLRPPLRPSNSPPIRWPKIGKNSVVWSYRRPLQSATSPALDPTPADRRRACRSVMGCGCLIPTMGSAHRNCSACRSRAMRANTGIPTTARTTTVRSRSMRRSTRIRTRIFRRMGATWSLRRIGAGGRRCTSVGWRAWAANGHLALKLLRLYIPTPKSLLRGFKCPGTI